MAVFISLIIIVSLFIVGSVCIGITNVTDVVVITDLCLIKCDIIIIIGCSNGIII